MDPGTITSDCSQVQSGGAAPLESTAATVTGTQHQNDVAVEDSEILRRLVRLLSKSEEDEIFAQDANRQPSSSGLHSHTLRRFKSEGDSTDIQLNRSRSILRLTDTAPLKVSRPPKVDLAETYKDFEKSSSKLRYKLVRLQGILRGVVNGNVISKITTKMSIHLESVTNYLKQQVELLAQADMGPPSEVHARNLISALSSLSQSTRALLGSLGDLREGGMLDDVEDFDALEGFAQLVESEARSLKDSRADESLKRMSGIRFRQHSAELNTEFAKASEDVATCLTGVIKSIVSAMRQFRRRENEQHLLNAGIAVLFSVVTAIMLSVSVDQGNSTLNLATSGVWIISLSCGVASGISGVVGLVFSDPLNQGIQQSPVNVSTWLTKSSEALFLIAATLFSVGLCLFAFSSSQAVAARAILIVVTSLHFVCLFILFAWVFRLRSADRAGPNQGSNHRGRGQRDSTWSALRNLAQLSIHAFDGNVAEGPGSSKRGSGDVEKGLHSARQASMRRRSAVPPIIRVTDTDQELTAQTQALTQTQKTSVPGPSRTGVVNADHDHVLLNKHGSPRNIPVHLKPTDNPDPGDDADWDSDSDSDEESEKNSHLTSLSFSPLHSNPRTHSAALTIPAAQRLSSDSSRSLPALPADVLIVRCMAYSPNGMFLCIGNASPQERCTILSADSPAITLGELKLTDIARQIEWSMDGENILLRLTHMIYVWNAMPSNGTRRPAIIIHQESDNVKWLINSDSFLSSKKDILTSFHVDGTPTGVFQIPASSIQEFVVTKDGHRVICLVSSFASARSGKTAASSQKLIVYNLDGKVIEQIAPVGRDAMNVVHSTVSPDIILVNFIGTTPPQIWRYRENTDVAERRTSTTFLSFKRAMSFKAPSGRFSGYGIFGNSDDQLILSLGEDGDMFIFASDTGQPLRHITTSSPIIPHSDRKRSSDDQPIVRRGRPLAQCFAWDPDILTFTVCMGYANGSILQWKIPLDAINQDPSTFTVVNLRDQDSTLIRPADADIATNEAKGDS